MTAIAAALSRSFTGTDCTEVALIVVAGLLMSAVLIHFGVDLGSTLSVA